ncbi:MAG TPA: DUF58 domain-containing protein, partial [Ktedonobacteraceae bacterium]|nr:DUF58 domain-containing protein [Ktedonobacteraceae bacterium]
VTLSLAIENAKLLPLPWLAVEDTLPRVLTIKGQKLPGSRRNDTVALESLFSTRWYERVTRRYTLQCNARGVHTFGPTKLRSSDIFGFVSREMELSNREYLLVYPLVAPLYSFGLPARHPFGDRRAQQRLLEDPLRVAGVRDYSYGDSLRRVNWKASARAMQLQSKIYESTTTHTLALFLNIVSQLDIYYGIRPDLQELSICATASIADWALDEGYAVGLYTNTLMFMPEEGAEQRTGESAGSNSPGAATSLLDRRRIRLPASSHGEQRRRIMEVLARIQSFFGSSIEDVLQTERTRLPAGSTVVLVTSMLSEQLIDILSRIYQNGHSVTILFVGDTPPPLKLANMPIYHIGGETTWQAFVEAYSKTADEQASGLQGSPGFHL